MMAYQKTIWTNREVERPRTYILQDNGDGTHTLIPDEGTIMEPGTPILAQNMNNIEDGIEALDNTVTSHLADTVTDNVHGLQDRFKDAQVIKSSIGGSGAVAIDMDLENGFYLLLISRDNAMYYIGVWNNEGKISEIIPLTGGNYEISITGKRLLVDFQGRTRGYALCKIS